MKRNKLFATVLSLTLIASALTGCNSTSTPVSTATAETDGSSQTAEAGTAANAQQTAAAGDKVSIVCTSFPQYDWVRQLTKGLDDSFDITYLQNTGVDLHSYQASAEDIMKIGSSDMFIYVGGESDSWVDGALKNAVNPNLVAINMLEELGDDVKEEEIKEGMQHDHDHDHEDEDNDHENEAEHDHDDADDHDHEDDADDHDDHKDADDHDHEAEVDDHDEHDDHDHADGEIEYDEHVWLSLENATELTEEIADKLETLAPDQATAIAANCDSYVAELNKLDSEYEAAVEASPIKTIIFGDRFPFRYLVDDYDLDYYAAFVGCSAETEASFETISFLTNKVDELQVPAILTIENSDQKVAKTILNNTKSKNQQILVMDSLQSVSQETINGGKTYLGTMQDNLETLKVALGVNA